MPTEKTYRCGQIIDFGDAPPNALVQFFSNPENWNGRCLRRLERVGGVNARTYYLHPQKGWQKILGWETWIPSHWHVEIIGFVEQT